MKNTGTLVIIFVLFSCLMSSAQNVGIGTSAPQSTLDVRGNFKAGGVSKFMSYDSVSGKLNWSNSFLFLPASQYIIQHSASAEGLFYGNSQLEYRNQLGNPAFYTNWQTGNAYFSGNVGLGIMNPTEKLQVNGNIKSNGLLFTSPKTFHYTLSGADFMSAKSTDTLLFSGGSGAVLLSATVSGKKVVAPLHLPDGAVMVKMTAVIYDGSTENLCVLMNRKVLLDNFFPDNLGFCTSAGQFTTAAYETPINGFANSNVIDNTLYSYFIDAQPANFNAVWVTFELRAVVIEYTMSGL